MTSGLRLHPHTPGSAAAQPLRPADCTPLRDRLGSTVNITPGPAIASTTRGRSGNPLTSGHALTPTTHDRRAP